MYVIGTELVLFGIVNDYTLINSINVVKTAMYIPLHVL